MRSPMKPHLTLSLVLPFVLAGSGPVWGQGQTISPTSRAVDRPESIQTEGTAGYWTHMEGQGRAGGALLGKVSVPGSPFLWDPVLVLVECQGTTVYATYSDEKGVFGIVATNIAGALSLQGDSKRQMETHLEGCRIRGALAGFRSNPI